MSLEAVIALAEAEVGKTEYPPNSNLTPYGQAYGLNGYPWCVMFLWDVFHRAGEALAFYGGAKTASCSQLYRWYNDMGLIVPLEEARRGDLIFLNFEGKTAKDHIGLATRVLGAGRVKTIEGNTTPGEEGSQDNGGSVAIKTRFANQIVGVARPMYMPEQEPDYAGHFAEEAIRWAYAFGLTKGYPDGTFQPDKSITRGETVEILYRYHNKFGGAK